MLNDIENIKDINIIISYQYNNIYDNNSNNIANYTVLDNNNIPNINENEYNNYLYNDIIFYYNISKYVYFTSLINNNDNIIPNDILFGSLSSYLDDTYDNILIKNMKQKINDNVVLYGILKNKNNNYNYLLKFNIIDNNDYDILYDIYNPYIYKLYLNEFNILIKNNKFITNKRLNMIFNDLIQLNIIIYGFNDIEINIDNNFFNKTIFNCIILVNDIDYFYMIDIPEDYFALVKNNNVFMYNISIDIKQINIF